MPPTEGPTDGKAAIPLYQQVIDIIKNEINSGAYKAGARIPNEFELAESYKVGRVTVRRAIEELVQQGYLTKRQGKGTFVKSVDLGLFMKPMLQLVDFDEIDIETIYSAREYIEGGIAYLAAQQRTNRLLQGIIYGALGFVLGLLAMQLVVRVHLF